TQLCEETIFTFFRIGEEDDEEEYEKDLLNTRHEKRPFEMEGGGKGRFDEDGALILSVS
ncbi:hypothetical protein Tco_0075170, partial [Tanacetum coccineum]